MKNQITDPMFPDCPIRNIIARIGDRWSILVLLTLEPINRPLRYKEIRQAIPDISQKMLTHTLRDLEADGLVLRSAYAEVPPRVEYSLTARARSLTPHLNNLVHWASENINDILHDRQQFYEE
ncbi:MAG: helix-turn-helix transcriptional regulator [Bacteroidales bacterium]|nr:helix-turn-helix transcriptional regulator [Bacteroidales bacterium]